MDMVKYRNNGLPDFTMRWSSSIHQLDSAYRGEKIARWTEAVLIAFCI